MSTRDEVERLRELLSRPDLPRRSVQDAAAASDEVKDALVRSVMHPGAPAPDAGLLARLEHFRTPANTPDLVAAYVANLGSPDPLARQASLFGLERLGYPGLIDAATAALQDAAEPVLTAAADILLRNQGSSEQVRALAEGVFQAHRDDPAFYPTLAVLQSHGIGTGPLPEPGGPDESTPV